MDKFEMMKERINTLGGNERNSNINTLKEHFKYYATSSPLYKRFYIDSSGVFIHIDEEKKYPLPHQIKDGEFAEFLITKSSNATTEYKFQTLSEFNIGTILWFSGYFWVVKEKNDANETIFTGKIKRCEHILNFEDSGEYYTIPYYIEKNTVSVGNDKYLAYSKESKIFKMSLNNITRKLSVNRRIMGEIFGDGIPQCWKITSLDIDEELLAVSVVASTYNENTDDIGLRLCDYNKVTKDQLNPVQDFIQTVDYSDVPLFVKSTKLKVDDTLIAGNNEIVVDTENTYTATESVIWDVKFIGGENDSGSDVGKILKIDDRTITVIGYSVGKYIVITAKTETREAQKQILIKNI